ncbi:VOC family protein [Zeaxanthinibacter enoshimensis]|uniref:VOC domain-containing protein n=1 Tax=Zeaxanthinibacter enoshimensis TaxID=392009 RepID=A0A4R6TLH9_9FLAO|nr:hypothetical protein [Zeaxanthinibacter enoshimensis]TDQ32214.1 hypothetical protein CLV82_0037 [Zeaxanthinibacter enoshimensis]
MISGAHAIIYSKDPDADKAFFRVILELTNVDVGHGWLIFGLPPSELAVLPSEDSQQHELYLMVEDVQEFVDQMSTKNIKCSEIQDQEWGLLTELTLPGGGKLGVYQPRHERPAPMDKELAIWANQSLAIAKTAKK